MKKLLAAMFVALLMVGCGGPDLDDKETLDGISAEAIDWNKLEWRENEGEGLYYAPDKQTLYSGRAKTMYDNGQIRTLVKIKNGKFSDLTHDWYKNGQLMREATYKDGKMMSAVVWKPNGEKCPVTNVVDGNGFLVWYNENGTEKVRNTLKDGEIVRD
jgi:antitoxin component YwqK of YwqJK toxin-antitoxin module